MKIKTTTSLILLGLITNINTAYAFQPCKNDDYLIPLLLIFIIFVILAIVSFIMTIVSVFSKKEDKDKKIRKWLIITISASIAAYITINIPIQC